MNVCIGICTYKRPEIKLTLASLAAQNLPKNVTFSIVVADNDATDVAKQYIEAAGKELNLTLKYVHAPKRNISIARNACLDNSTSSIFLTIDDDQVASKDWLMLMLDRFNNDKADVVFGPVQAIYENHTPEWIMENDFHSHQPVLVGGEIKTGYTGNTLINLDKSKNLRFDLNYGRTGGEDTDFFSKMYENGSKLSFEPLAIVKEPVPIGRLSMKWLLKRKFRMGQSYAQVSIDSSSLGLRLKVFLLSIVKFLICFITATVFSMNKNKSTFWSLRGCFHLGVSSRIFGFKQIENY